MNTNLPLPSFRRGKVRDVYELGEELLIVSTDRISAFDVVLPCGIPDKGKVLNQLSAFWFKKTARILRNHLIKVIDSDVILNEVKNLSSQPRDLPDSLIGRSMLVAKAERIPVECVVRGYLSGSAWAEYEETGKVGDIDLPPGIKESQELSHPIFTPTTKSETEHDRPLTNQDIKDLRIGGIFKELERESLLIYSYARDYAKGLGIIIADTKFEFGFINSRLALIDELLTPDSSRFWEVSQYEVGHSQPSFDKQPVRDWLSDSGWDKKPPAPMLPPEVIEKTSERYREVYNKLTGDVLRG
ncbi:MAG: phosphoribosylaminoimidazolesuccinocarboxamide synthase [Chloroflexi bacterium RBG_13_51_36]|nr:MAG: phosphoribosylaminoimidazolesuccinocarboxamide synthase [Chloroflexi bacterium RBG_13_51_36]